MVEGTNWKGDKSSYAYNKDLGVEAFIIPASEVYGGIQMNRKHSICEAIVKELSFMTNVFEIRNFYVINKEYYKFYNLVIIQNKGIVPACLEHLNKNKVKKMFNDHSIMTAIGYIEDNKILLTKTNFSEQ